MAGPRGPSARSLGDGGRPRFRVLEFHGVVPSPASSCLGNAIFWSERPKYCFRRNGSAEFCVRNVTAYWVFLVCRCVCIYMYITASFKLDDFLTVIGAVLVLAKSLLGFRHCLKGTSLLPDKKI